VVALALTAPTVAQYELSWFTIDGGGAMFSTGGSYALGGTIGQHDAGPESGPLTGGTYSLVGGFWPVAQVCTCLGDMNGDGLKDARDIQRFVSCMVAGESCSCADVDSVGGVTTADIAVFVGDLLAGNGCP
jgi:hypothetical protein